MALCFVLCDLWLGVVVKHKNTVILIVGCRNCYSMKFGNAGAAACNLLIRICSVRFAELFLLQLRVIFHDI
jgi:hypothetical protein